MRLRHGRDAAAGNRRRGQALVEFLIIFPTLILLVLGAFQFALIYQAKQTLNYATFMAARQGSLKNGRMTPIKDGLAAGMTPLFNIKPEILDTEGLLRARLIAAVEAFNPLNTRVEILNPTAAAYNAHKGDSEDGKSIPNDNLMYRSSAAKGGMSVQDANLLTIRVTYCTRLVVPIVNRVIYALYFGFSGEQVLAGEYYAETTAPASALGARCLDINDNIQALSALIASLPAPANSLATLLSSVPSIPTTIPGLNWNIGGYRIPIVATATVRMQSPVTQAP
jgi:hypothetical protein